MKNSGIVIVDLGIGNLGSIKNMLKKLGYNATITNNYDEIKSASKIILAGVGSFDRAMSQINELNIFDLLVSKAKEEKIPFFGICLGMQLLTRKSAEGKLKGLGIIEADTLSFKSQFINSSIQLRVPHMGWNYVNIINDSNFTENSGSKDKFYFVHSFYVKCDSQKNVSMEANYGFNFAAAIFDENVYGAQFHPEKSHSYGISLFKNFVEM